MSRVVGDPPADTPSMKLRVGDVVVYGAHGAGSIAARETREVDGAQEVVIVLALSRGLSVELPLTRAEELLRPAADEAELGRVSEVLAADAARSSVNWVQRQREARVKLQSTMGLAEILRDGAQRAETPSKLSPSERELVKRARELLATEIALSRGVEPDEAGDWIDAQLSG